MLRCVRWPDMAVYKKAELVMMRTPSITEEIRQINLQRFDHKVNAHGRSPATLNNGNNVSISTVKQLKIKNSLHSIED